MLFGSHILENVWLVLSRAVVARPQRGERDLPEGFKILCVLRLDLHYY
jgi:hypothetical protein